VIFLPPTVAPTIAIANSKGMFGREYSCSHVSAKQHGGTAYKMKLLRRPAFWKQENATSCKDALNYVIHEAFIIKSARKGMYFH
jgi:hypothetical protein